MLGALNIFPVVAVVWFLSLFLFCVLVVLVEYETMSDIDNGQSKRHLLGTVSCLRNCLFVCLFVCLFACFLFVCIEVKRLLKNPVMLGRSVRFLYSSELP